MTAFSDQGPVAAMLPDGRRLHLQHGPIDLIIEAFGQPHEVKAAYCQATSEFRTVLSDLASELTTLRKPVSANARPDGAVAQRMWAATITHAAHTFVTPMAAVAGSVADHILIALTKGRALERAYVNNGGDIALHLGADRSFDIGVCSDPDTGAHAATIRIDASEGICGVATSGWRGRSCSLGIADAVTVLADCAADADAAATLIANAVDVPDAPDIERRKAFELFPDSDLGDRPVTVAVPQLSASEIASALERGVAAADRMRERGIVRAAFIVLQGEMRSTGNTGATFRRQPRGVLEMTVATGAEGVR